MSTHAKIPSGLGARRDETNQEDEHDTYKLPGKLKEPTGANAADWQGPGSKECAYFTLEKSATILASLPS
jgi:hypothetical protein